MSARDAPTGPASVLRTRDVAALAGTTPRALRHYHRIGLLPEAPRDANGYRRYSAADLVRVLRIRELAASGMPLREVARALDQDPSSLSHQLDDLERVLDAQAERIERQRGLLRELRRTLHGPAQALGNPRSECGSGAGRESQTAQLDRDVWLLATGTGAIDSATAAHFEAAVAQQFADLGAAPSWLQEFAALEGEPTIDAQRADHLAGAIAAFAAELTAGHDFAGASDGAQVLDLAAELQGASLSGAQLEVWRRFEALIRQ
ncbi:MerR family transcriptional regulator [Leucobacter edaphi]|uniref:MerR family transcriptional regulator n=1 Tax=Leucobacter edaphi TaxID=2796472 RepID=UPI0034E21BAB